MPGKIENPPIFGVAYQSIIALRSWGRKMKNRTLTECGRKMDEKDSHLSDLNMSPNYQSILQIMRLYMQSVSHPSSMAWMAALSGAETAFGPTSGPQIAARTLEVLQQVRMSRKSVFRFNSPTCPCCCQIVTEHERRFMLALDSTNSGAAAKMELIMLCEGNDVTLALNAMNHLNQLIAEFLASDTQTPRPADHIVRGVM